MNTITINGLAYKLPEEQNILSSVLNHLDMVKNGTKKFIKLYDLDGMEHKFSTTYLNSVEIDVKID